MGKGHIDVGTVGSRGLAICGSAEKAEALLEVVVTVGGRTELTSMGTTAKDVVVLEVVISMVGGPVPVGAEESPPLRKRDRVWLVKF